MLDVLNVLIVRSLTAEQPFKPLFALCQREVPKVFSAFEQQIEDEVDQIAGATLGERRLQRREIRCTIVIERHHFAVDDAVRKAARCIGDGGKLGVQSSPWRVRMTPVPSSSRSCMR